MNHKTEWSALMLRFLDVQVSNSGAETGSHVLGFHCLLTTNKHGITNTRNMEHIRFAYFPLALETTGGTARQVRPRPLPSLCFQFIFQ